MANKLTQLAVVTVANAGTRVQITSSDIHTPAVILQADSANTGKVFVGDITVSSTNGIALAADEAVSLDSELLRGSSNDFILSDIYVDTATNGNKVKVSYLVRR